ncbi:hypothetical protein GY45DRAFT_1224459, partial [Cubamyces sp. BRFM 1775]
VFTANAFLRRLGNHTVIMRDGASGARFHYSAEQLRLYSRFDYGLRSNHYSGPDLLMPAGYEEFRRLWAQDADCPSQFVQYDPVTGHITVTGGALDLDEFAPLRPAPPPVPASAPATTPPSEGPLNTPRRRAIVDELIWSQLERDLKGKEAYRLRKEKRAR